MTVTEEKANDKAGWKQKVQRPGNEFPRKFIPTTADLANWDSIEPLLKGLINAPLQSSEDLQDWLTKYAEFFDVIGEEESRLYIDMTCFTDDKIKEKAFLHFVENIDPKLAPYSDKLNHKINDSSLAKNLDANTYGRWQSSIRSDIEIFTEKNIPIHTEISKIVQQYQKLSASLTVNWKGENKTLSQMSIHLHDPDRSIREEAWKLIADKRLKEKDNYENIFQNLFQNRQKIAENLNEDSFISYIYKAYHRSDYTPSDCSQFAQSVEKLIVPRYREILKHRQEKMKLSSLRPWDFSVDPLGRQPLKPFGTTAELISKVGHIFEKLDSGLHGMYQVMVEKQLLDLENRVGKAPGGYQCSLAEVRLPFIFMNSVGLNDDVYTLLHESGHAFHLMLNRNRMLGYNRHAPMEFSEVASMSMERIGSHFLDEFYQKEDWNRSLQDADEEVFRLLCWVAMVDQFQHEVYKKPESNAADRKKIWEDLERRFGANPDYSGLEQYQGYGWHRQLHVFEVPFYYIEYGIAQLGALQVWNNYLKDPQKALIDYKKGLSLGGTQGVRKLFDETNIQFDMSEKGIGPAVEAVWNRWQQSIT